MLICTHSPAGALPLGILLTSDETEGTLSSAFRMYCDILPEASFYGRGVDVGPSVIMTDNCGELRAVLHERWPSAVLLLCVFHVLQQVWRWIYDKTHGIAADHRVEIMKLFRLLMYAESEVDLDAAIEQVIGNQTVVRYPEFVMYLEDLIERKEEWAICFRAALLIRGCQTNNYIEAQFLVVKDTILRRTRVFNINALLRKLFEDFEDHFKFKLLSIADGSYDGIFSRRFRGMTKTTSGISGYTVPSSEVQDRIVAGCVPHGRNIFSVPSKTDTDKTYVVDMTLGCCECKVIIRG